MSLEKEKIWVYNSEWQPTEVFRYDDPELDPALRCDLVELSKDKVDEIINTQEKWNKIQKELDELIAKNNK